MISPRWWSVIRTGINNPLPLPPLFLFKKKQTARELLIDDAGRSVDLFS
jgi:hypothetical protein